MSLFDAALRTERVTVERATTVRDSYGEDTETWQTVFQDFASVRNGTGEERRRAAQEGGSQPATFGFAYSSGSAAISISDRLRYAGAAWDITSAVIEPRNAGVVVTAVRSAEASEPAPMPEAPIASPIPAAPDGGFVNPDILDWAP